MNYRYILQKWKYLLVECSLQYSIIVFQIECHNLCCVNNNDENNPECVVNILSHYFKRNGNIFIAVPSFLHSSNHRIKSHLRLSRSVQNDSMVCSNEQHLSQHETLHSNLINMWENSIEEAIKMECHYVHPRRNTISNNVNNIIKNIHKITSWTIIIDDQKNYCNYDYHIFDGFVFILHAYDIEFMHNSQKVMTNLSLHKARVIILILGLFRNKENLFQFLTQYSLNNSIIIHQDKHKHLEVISRSHDRCGNFKVMYSLGYCNGSNYIQSQDVINRNTGIYSKCKLPLFGVNNPPFSMTKPNSFNVIDGIELKLLSIIASYLNFDLQDIGSQGYNMIFEIKTGQTTYIYGHTYTIQYMERYYTQRYTWIVPRAEPHPQWSSLTRVFKSEIWICVLLILSLWSVILKYLGHIKNNEIVLCFINLWAILLNIALKEKPSLFTFRVIFITWVLTSIAFNTVFQAQMRSFFINPGTQHQINTIKELEESSLNLAVSSSLFYFVNSLHNTNKSAVLIFTTDCGMLNFCFYNKNVAALTSKEIFLYNSHFNLKNSPTSSFHLFTDAGVNYHRTLHFHMRNPFVPLVNKITKRLVEAGIVSKIVANFSDPSGWAQSVRISKPLLFDYVALSLLHMTSPFMYLIFGLILNTLAFVIEVFNNKIFFNHDEL